MPAAKLQLVDSDPAARAKKPASPTKKRTSAAKSSPAKKKPAASANSGSAAASGGTSKTPPASKRTAKSEGAKSRPRTEKRETRALDVMTRDVACCRAEDSLNTAAKLMWERDVGALVVVGDQNEPLSMVTDRDLCMAAYTQGVPLAFGSVASAMASQLVTCKEGASLAEVRSLIAEHRVRRLPVVDDAGKLVGLIGLGDLVGEAASKLEAGRKRGTSSTEFLELQAALLTPLAEEELSVRAG